MEEIAYLVGGTGLDAVAETFTVTKIQQAPASSNDYLLLGLGTPWDEMYPLGGCTTITVVIVQVHAFCFASSARHLFAQYILCKSANPAPTMRLHRAAQC